MRYQTILLFGAPGSGKGTQGRILGSIPGLFHFACGDVFRKLSIDDPLGKVFIEYSSRGELVPDEATISLWRRNIEACILERRFDPHRDILVLDGIPRNRTQAEILQETLAVKMILHLDCPDPDKILGRLQRRALQENRLDDTHLDVIKGRLVTYEASTRPVLDYYGSALVHHIDATQSPIPVLRDILASLVTILP